MTIQIDPVFIAIDFDMTKIYGDNWLEIIGIDEYYKLREKYI